LLGQLVASTSSGHREFHPLNGRNALAGDLRSVPHGLTGAKLPHNVRVSL
jgi:hypothetical protein